jgi:predicted HTH transcriptional regulator
MTLNLQPATFNKKSYKKMDISATIQLVITQGENQNAEFKTSFGDEVIISLVAFANAKGGKVYVGVND